MGSLDRIEISGFKSIRNLDLKLNSLNILIGANGAGKTNFISMFKLLNNLVEQNLQLYVGISGGASSILYFGQKITDQIFIRLYFGQNGYEAKLIPATGDSLIFAEEKCWWEKSKTEKYSVPLNTGQRETVLHHAVKKPRGGIAKYVLEALESWKVYHFHDTSDSAKVKSTGDIDDNAFFRPDASNLAAFLYLLQETQPEYYDRIVSTIQLVAPFFDNFILRPTPSNPNKIRLEWREKGSDSYFNANTLSDGTLRFICLTTLLLQPNLPSTILIDEPELGLHPYAITLLASLLQSAAEKTQVIVSTQSVPLVNQFSLDDIIVVDKEDGQSSFKRLTSQDMTEWLEDYGLGDLWEKNLIGGRP